MSESKDRDDEHGHDRVIHYTVDGEPQTTKEDELSANQIVKNAGLDPAQRYLSRLVPGREPISYQNKMDTEIKMHEGMAFITAGTGPTPTS